MTPLYDDGRCSVWHARAEAWLPTIEDASVDLILTDPPFCGVKDEDWDRQWKDEAHYLRWLGGIADEWRRVLKPNGSLYCFASPQMAARVELLLGERFTVLNRITWRKPPFSTKAEMFRKEDMRAFFPASEAIIFCEQVGDQYDDASELLHKRVFGDFGRYFLTERERAGVTRNDLAAHLDGYKNVDSAKANIWNWELGKNLINAADYGAMRAALNRVGGDYLQRDYAFLRKEYDDLRKEYDDLRRPFVLSPQMAYTDVWDYRTVNTYPGKHPCAKPVALLEHCITASTRPDALVLDCFLGSGATLRAAKNLGRRGLGCEADGRWARKAGERCRQEAFAFDLEAAG